MTNSLGREAALADQDLTREDLVARAAALRDVLWESAAANDRARRLSDDVIAEITESGLIRLMTPKRLGGYQTDIRTLLEVEIELGRGCCSASWVTGVLNVGNFAVSLFGEEAQRDVWAQDSGARTALVLGRPSTAVEEVDDGLLVSGEWGYVSGSPHAEWVGVLVATGADSGPPVPYLALLPIGDVEVKDTWFFTGMRATASNTVVAEQVFVPRHRLLPYLPALHGETDGVVDERHIYRNSLTGAFAIGLIGSLIGGADAAFEFTLRQAASRPVAGSTYSKQVDSPTTRLDLAAAAVKIDTAKLFARRVADTVDQYALAGENPDVLTRARARMDSTHVARNCREAVDLLVTAHGSSAFSESNPLQRIWRDVHVGSRHAGFGMGIPEQVYGHALTGKDPREISILV